MIRRAVSSAGYMQYIDVMVRWTVLKCGISFVRSRLANKK